MHDHEALPPVVQEAEQIVRDSPDYQAIQEADATMESAADRVRGEHDALGQAADVIEAVDDPEEAAAQVGREAERIVRGALPAAQAALRDEIWIPNPPAAPNRTQARSATPSIYDAGALSDTQRDALLAQANRQVDLSQYAAPPRERPLI